MDNRISITIPKADLDKLNAAFAEIRSIFGKYAQSLTPEQRKRLPKMANGTEPFVSRVQQLSVSNPEFNPPYMDVAELKKDFDSYMELKPFDTICEQLADEFSDTTMLCGSEAYVQALSYYNSVKVAAKMNVNGAKAIYDELKQRFERSSRRSDDE